MNRDIEMSHHTESSYVAWKKFQRRVDSLAPELGTVVHYYHFSWEERSPVHKLASYAVKFVATFHDLLRQRPARVFVQVAPTPALYAVAAYAYLFRASYVADCHNSMIYGHWRRWPFAGRLLRTAEMMLVHNVDVAEKAGELGLTPVVLRTPLPVIRVQDSGVDHLARLGLKARRYVIVPGNLAKDEPIEEVFRAASRLPDLTFVFTWFAERLPAKFRAAAPPNVLFCGYQSLDAFNAIFANAAAAVVLTTREGTQPSGAAEAMALEVPLVLSNLRTTRRINKRAAVYVANDASAISAGIEIAIRERENIQSRMRELKGELIQEMASQIISIKYRLKMQPEFVHLNYLKDASTATSGLVDYQPA